VVAVRALTYAPNTDYAGQWAIGNTYTYNLRMPKKIMGLSSYGNCWAMPGNISVTMYTIIDVQQ